eukprot:TRINITY_DN87203_c0_g1_i1.p1 TRINITY_DN87203_c0_g1~~TRINITY_DN87203_c0_g1_i1.p1  ORF type:complete len:934 (+),score=139.13 TRINITY_DN87203_c0_g1_i1:26-2803(+)
MWQPPPPPAQRRPTAPGHQHGDAQYETRNLNSVPPRQSMWPSSPAPCWPPPVAGAHTQPTWQGQSSSASQAQPMWQSPAPGLASHMHPVWQGRVPAATPSPQQASQMPKMQTAMPGTEPRRKTVATGSPSPTEMQPPRKSASAASARSQAISSFEVSSGSIERTRGNYFETVTKMDRGMRLAVAVGILTLCLTIGLTSSWQQQVITARPDEVYRVHATLASMMPGEGDAAGSQHGRLSKTPQPVFTLKAGLLSAYVLGLCDPHESFGLYFDKAACHRKLEGFCDSLHESTPNDRWLKNADKLYTECMNSIQKEEGLSIPLMGGPVHTFWSGDPEPASSHSRGLEKCHGDDVQCLEDAIEFGPADLMPNFCATVADCDMLEAMRPWNMAVAVLYFLGMVALIGAALFFLGDLLHPNLKRSKPGFLSMGAGLSIIMLSALMYLHVAHTYPISRLVRSESLFYFILPQAHPQHDFQTSLADDIETPQMAAERSRYSPVHLKLQQNSTQETISGWPQDVDSLAGNMNVLSRQLQWRDDSAAPGAPVSRWKGVLLSLTGALLEGLMTGDMTKFYKRLGESLSRAWELANLLFENWLGYLRRAIDGAPGDGQVILKDFGNTLQRLDDQLIARVDALNKSGSEGEKCLISMAPEVHQELRSILEREREADEMFHDGSVLVAAINERWQTLRGPIIRVTDRIKKLFHEGGVASILREVGHMVLDKATVQDLKSIFTSLFNALPQVVQGVRQEARMLANFTSSMGPLTSRIKETLKKLRPCISTLAHEDVAAEEKLTLAQIDEAIAQLSEPGGLRNLAGHWTDLSPKDLDKLFGDADPGKPAVIPVAKRVAPFSSGRISNPMLRIGTIFLGELEQMRSGGRAASLQASQDSQLCSMQMPSACTNLGLGMLALGLMSICLLACGLVTAFRMAAKL